MAAIRLDGSEEPQPLGGGYGIAVPGAGGSAEVVTGGRSRRGQAKRGLRRAPKSAEVLDAALRRAGMRQRKVVQVSLGREAATVRRRGASARRGPGEKASAHIALDVPVPEPGTAQVVLATDEFGGMSWHLPEPAPRAALRGRRAPSQQRFVIPIGGGPAPKGAGKRGVIGVVGKVLLKVLVYPLTDKLLGAVGERFAAKWEAKHRPYGWRTFTPANYQNPSAPRLTDDNWQRLAAGRSLLFIHGTFSTASGGFGALPRDAMQALYDRYGQRVFAVNLPTLSEDPEENARWILKQIPKRISLDVDIVCHSRGGLVARELTQRQAQLGPRASLKVGSVVFVGVPNAGTALADPDHMVKMLDRVTSATSLVPAGPVAEVLDAVVVAVKVLAHSALRGLRGLASMNPAGEFLPTLNTDGDVSARYYAITADYEPPLGGPLFRIAERVVGDTVMDSVFEQAPNDLVVPTEGVAAANGGPGFPIADTDCLQFALKRGVMHTTYFQQPETAAALVQWLEPPPSPRMAAPPPTRRQSRSTGSGRALARFSKVDLPKRLTTFTKVKLRKRFSTAIQPRRMLKAKPPAPSDEGVTVERSPAITTDKEPVPGAAVTVTIDLLFREEHPETESAGVRIRAPSADWQALDVDVRLDAHGIRLATREGTITVRRNERSIPFATEGAVGRDAKTVKIVASFFYRGRFCGNAKRTFVLAPEGGAVSRGGAGAAEGATGASRPAATTGRAVIDTAVDAPRLTVLINRLDDARNSLFWRIEVHEQLAGLPIKRTGTTQLGRSPEAFAQDMMQQFENAVPGQHTALFEGIGESLYRLTPDFFRKAYWALREHSPGFPIQFVTDDPFIPWELMCPAEEGREAGLLVLEHPVARWLSEYEGAMRGRFGRGRIVAVAPVYDGTHGLQPLPGAEGEVKMLRKDFDAEVLTPATSSKVLALLARSTSDPPVAILHFAGHGNWGTPTANSSAVWLQDSPLTVPEVKRSKTTLGTAFGTFVVLNACEVARAGLVLTWTGGFADAFLARSFGGLLAPMWSVADGDARWMIEEFYKRAYQGERPVGEVIRELRQEKAAKSPTVLSYVYYGDVMAAFRGIP